MNIFVTGATGVFGRGTVTRLVERGHRVRGVARSDTKAAWLLDHGAEPVTVDLFDGAALKDAVAGSEAVLHLATNIPPMKDMPKPSAWQTNNELRTTTTRLLVDAALDHGVGTFVAESITFPYIEKGEEWITEADPWVADAALQSMGDLENEVQRFIAHGGRGIALRFGLFYGPETRSTDEMLGLARKGLAPFPGAPDSFLSSIHTEDAAAATAAALDVPSGVYNVCDDEPVRRREAADAFAVTFGLRKQHFLPRPVVRLATRTSADVLMRSQRVSNAKFREAAHWAPQYHSLVDGWPAVAAARAQAAQS